MLFIERERNIVKYSDSYNRKISSSLCTKNTEITDIELIDMKFRASLYDSIPFEMKQKIISELDSLATDNKQHILGKLNETN